MHQNNKKSKQNSCLICFKDLNEDISISNLFFNNIICDNCLSSFKILNKTKEFFGINVLFLYEYNNFMKQLIYKYKGCYDIELSPVFLNGYKKLIRRKYKGYTIIFPPSNLKEDKQRGFLHIEEIVKNLKMKYEVLFYKKEEHKQSALKYKERSNVEKIIDVIESKKIINKKYLIVDDIFTSGSTLKTIVKILIKNKVKIENISALIIAKTTDIVEL